MTLFAQVEKKRKRKKHCNSYPYLQRVASNDRKILRTQSTLEGSEDVSLLE